MSSGARKARGAFGWLGPGVVMAASGIGASDVITATVAGATYGLALIWAVALGAFFKFALSEGLARWQLATGLTPVEGWAAHLPRWTLGAFGLYLVVWGVAVSGAMVSGCGLAIESITGGAVPRTWGGFMQACAAFALIWFARGAALTRLMKPLIAVMFVGIVGCAALTFRDPAAALSSLLAPRIPEGAGASVLSIIGGIGGSVTLLNYSYLQCADERSEARDLRATRIDLAKAYIFTAIFGISVMLIANRVFFAEGIVITDGQAITRMAGSLAAVSGSAGFYVYSIGFWAAALASLVGVWQTIPSIFAETYYLLKRRTSAERADAARPGAPAYRAALAFMAISSAPFAFMGRPLLVVIVFTVLGSFFIPFVAATLLYLNSRGGPHGAVYANRFATKIVLALILILFTVLGAVELAGLFRR